MTFDDLAPYADVFRHDKYRFNAYLGTPSYTVVFSRSVSDTSLTYPCKQLHFNDQYGGVGAFGDVKEDMLIHVYHQNTSILKGRLRVAHGASSSNTLQVSEFNRGTCDVRTGDRIDIIDVPNIFSKLVSATDEFLPDSRWDYDDEHDNYRILVGGGGDRYGLLDRDPDRPWLFLTTRTTEWDWLSTTWNPDPDSDQDFAYDIDYGGGTVTVGDTDTATATVTYEAGEYIVTATLTDNDTGSTGYKRIRVRVYDLATDPPLKVSGTLRYDGGQAPDWSGVGWNATLKLPDHAQGAFDDLPNGAPICLFGDDQYGGVYGSYGAHALVSDQSNILANLFLVSHEVSIDQPDDDLTFEATSPLGILEKIGALPQLLIRDASPSNWQEFKGLTTDIALMDMFYYRTSASTFFDLLLVDTREFAYSILEITDDSSLAGQMRDLAKSCQARLTCDRFGRILIIRDPDLMSMTDRATRTLLYTAIATDAIGLSWSTDHWLRTKFVQVQAIKAGTEVSAQTALFANGPGDAPGEGNDSATITKVIASNQSDVNRLAGEYDAQANSLYWDESTGAIRQVPNRATATMKDGYGFIDPAWLDYIGIVVDAADNQRADHFDTSTRWTVPSLSLTFDADTGGRTVVWNPAHETHGVPGTPWYPDTNSGLPTTVPIRNFSPGTGVLPPQPPIAAFSASPTSGTDPLLVTFTNESYGDVGGGYLWDFDDASTSTDTHPQHTFTPDGSYDVLLTVTGSTGLTDDVTHTITVSSAPTPSRRMMALRGTSLCLTGDFETLEGDGGPSWSAIGIGAGGRWFTDRASAGYGLEMGQVDGWILESANLHRVEDVYGGAPTKSLLHAFEFVPLSFAVSPNGLCMVAVGIGDIRDYAYDFAYSSFRSFNIVIGTWSEDGGSTWETVRGIGQNLPTGTYGTPGADIGDDGIAFVSAGYGNSSNLLVPSFASNIGIFTNQATTHPGYTWDVHQVVGTCDPGDTSWPGVGGLSLVGAIRISGDYLFYGSDSYLARYENVCYTPPAAANLQNQSPTDGGYPYGPRHINGAYHYRSMDVADDGTLFVVGYNSTTGKWGLFTSDDDGDTWTTIRDPDAGDGLTMPTCAQADPANAGCCFFDNGRDIYYWDTSTLDNRIGDLYSVSGDGGGEGLAT